MRSVPVGARLCRATEFATAAASGAASVAASGAAGEVWCNFNQPNKTFDLIEFCMQVYYKWVLNKFDIAPKYRLEAL